jgi:hypothetical protein
MKTAGSNILFAILTEVSDNVLKGAETGGIDGMVRFVYDDLGPISFMQNMFL